MNAIWALTKAAWFQARSYRLSLAFQIGGVFLTVIPIYFISGALQETMADTISTEAPQFFAFVLVGSVALMLITAAMSTLQGVISGGITTGYFESLLMTRAPLPAILVGLSSYGVIMTAIRAGVMLTAGWLLGASVAWSQIAPALLILALLVAAHWGFGLVNSAMVIAFRTVGPLPQLVIALSVLFGGVYYPVSSIPSWLGSIAAITPLAYGLRALRRVLLQGESLAGVGVDVAMVAAMAVVLLLAGSLAMGASMRYARRAGTLGSY